MLPLLSALQSTKHTRWEALGKAAAVSGSFACCFRPRQQVQVAQLASLALQQDFDFCGVVMHVGPRQPQGHSGMQQWVFLADESCSGGQQQQQQGGAAGRADGAASTDSRGGGGGEDAAQQQQQQPYMLAVRLVGHAEAVDFFDQDRSLGSVVSLRNLVLENHDATNSLWAAVGSDTVEVRTLAAAGQGGRRLGQGQGEALLGWARANGQLVDQLQARVRRLVGC